MSKNQKRIDQLNKEKLEAVEEHNKIIDKIEELNLAKQAFKMKAFSCEERVKELQQQSLEQAVDIN
tara:strand:- start:358 stop:555 length:198 start_codon:yes stop_codon:yes gene_type:complete